MKKVVHEVVAAFIVGLPAAALTLIPQLQGAELAVGFLAGAYGLPHARTLAAKIPGMPS